LHALGTHVLVELQECNSKLLNDLKKVEEFMVSAAKEARATILKVYFHKFSPFGISGAVVIAESHLTIHTWPEYKYAAVDIFTCGDLLQPQVAADYLIEKFQCKQPSIVEVKRGLLAGGNDKLPHKPLKEVPPYGRTEELQMVP
jgi:S-adenosylmethionine decarboxylase